MTPDDLAYIKLICKRPRMFYGSALSFADVVAFICGVQSSPDGPHAGRFSDCHEPVAQRLYMSRDVPWTDSLIDAFADIDMYDACGQLYKMLVEWEDTTSNGYVLTASPVAQHCVYARAFGTPSLFGDADWPWYNSDSSGTVRFVLGGVVKTFRCTT